MQSPKDPQTIFTVNLGSELLRGYKRDRGNAGKGIKAEAETPLELGPFCITRYSESDEHRILSACSNLRLPYDAQIYPIIKYRAQ